MASPPNWSAPASMTFFIRSRGLRCSTPHARAGNGWPMISESEMSPQSVQTIPSKP